MNKLGVLEGLLFAVGDEGLSIDNIKSILDVSETEAKNLLSMLQKRYESDEYGLRISYLGENFKLTTKREHKEYYQIEKSITISNLCAPEKFTKEELEDAVHVDEKFGKTTSAFLDEIITLNKKNQLLQETRDLLLPRLISGKLSVEHLVEKELAMVAEPTVNYRKTKMEE